MLRIGFYTDEPVSAQGLLAMIAGQAGLEGEWIPANAPHLVAPALERNKDMVVIDCAACDPLVVASDIRRDSPATLLVLWARELSVEVAGAALAIGVRGIVKKTSAAEQIVLAFQVIHAGELWLERKLTSELLATKQINLSPRESELVVLVSRGLKNREIAEEMDLTEGTVKIYLSRLFEKTGTRDRLSLALLGLQQKGQAGAANLVVRQVVAHDSSLRTRRRTRTLGKATQLAPIQVQEFSAESTTCSRLF